MYNNAVKQQDLAIKEIQTLSNTNDPNIVKSDLSLCGARSEERGAICISNFCLLLFSLNFNFIPLIFV